MTLKRVLVAPLNWGLGHATRCIPIIRSLLKQKHDVVLASDGRARTLLRAEFPSLVCEPLPSYNVLYPLKQPFLHWLKEGPRILDIVKDEHTCTQELVLRHNFTHIFSDNRYGVYHPECKSIFITHQLSLPLPVILAWIANKVVRKLINKFDECWIPDIYGEESLSGEMSQGLLKIPLVYVGPLSRFEKPATPKGEDILAIVSGPEPNRSQIEEKILDQLAKSSQHYEVIRGRPEKLGVAITTGIQTQEVATSQVLQQKLASAAFVVSRSGYSSIMDLYRVQRKALLIPTPNQPEQQALAERHRKNQNFVFQTEDTLDISSAIEHLKKQQPTWPNVIFANPDELVRMI